VANGRKTHPDGARRRQIGPDNVKAMHCGRVSVRDHRVVTTNLDVVVAVRLKPASTRSYRNTI